MHSSWSESPASTARSRQYRSNGPRSIARRHPTQSRPHEKRTPRTLRSRRSEQVCREYGERGYYFFAVCSLRSNAMNSSLLILPSLLVSASAHLARSFGSAAASVLSMKPSLFLSSLANSAASSSPARGVMVDDLAGSLVVAGVDGFCVCAAAGNAVIRPAALRIDNTKPER